MKKATELLDLLDAWLEEIDALEAKHSKVLYCNTKRQLRVGGRAHRVMIQLVNAGND